MKKYLILLLIIFISCGSPESLEEEIVPLEEEIVSLEEEDNNKPDSSSEDQQEASSEAEAVSYTHLTLPTILLV